jgi:hypothetical protein
LEPAWKDSCSEKTSHPFIHSSRSDVYAVSSDRSIDTTAGRGSEQIAVRGMQSRGAVRLVRSLTDGLRAEPGRQAQPVQAYDERENLTEQRPRQRCCGCSVVAVEFWPLQCCVLPPALGGCAVEPRLFFSLPRGRPHDLAPPNLLLRSSSANKIARWPDDLHRRGAACCSSSPSSSSPRPLRLRRPRRPASLAPSLAGLPTRRTQVRHLADPKSLAILMQTYSFCRVKYYDGWDY